MEDLFFAYLEGFSLLPEMHDTIGRLPMTVYNILWEAWVFVGF
jgi:hypothetical protein